MLSLSEAIDFRNLLTNERVWKYNNELCKNTGLKNIFFNKFNVKGTFI